MYIKHDNTAIINGSTGKYDSVVQNQNVAWGRNAIDSFKNEYLANYTQPRVEFPDMSNLKGLSKDEFTKKMNEFNDSIQQMKQNEQNRAPINFELQYTNNSDMKTKEAKESLLGAAFEEMEGKSAISTTEMTQKLQQTADELFDGNSVVEMTADALDINNDGQIDVGEYASSILASDLLSNKGQIKGIINQDGLDATIAYGVKKNYEIASRQYKALYDFYNLQSAGREFMSNPNNIAS